MSTKKPSKDKFALISTTLHAVSLVAIAVLIALVAQLTYFVNVIDRSSAESDAFYSARAGNTYQCLKHQDFECPEWKYVKMPTKE